ncbi:MAG TPA: sulfurtransferase [Verrucomicrobiae bacterium]|jgi:thiosulfate/3-mercaptopyruvate sulfurtransferase|nr:sulfurtransferase [Verrucomicrobiae bacterium]
MSNYSHPETLVDVAWAKAHLEDPKVKFVEIDVDTSSYDSGHIPGAVAFNWRTELQNQVSRDIISKEAFEKLLGAAGISNDTEVILYGDNNNWFAAYGFWLFKLYGHDKVRLLNGGRIKWLNENDAPLTKEPAKVKPATYEVKSVHNEFRALLPEVLEASSKKNRNLVDVRSGDEFTGKIIAPPNLPETAQRAGHIPGAKSIPWSTAVNSDGAFKSADDLRKIYLQEKGVDPAKAAIAYCRIGERSSHTWFVLKYLLGINDVKNYDGSWTEYGNLIGAPIENPSGGSGGTK